MTSRLTSAIIVLMIFTIATTLAFPLSGEKLEKAISKYRKTVNRNPNDFKLHRELILKYKRAGMMEVPLAVYERAYGRYSEVPVVMYSLGLAYLIGGDKSKLGRARDLIERAAEKADSPWIKLALGEVYSELGDDQRAVSIWREILPSEIDVVYVRLIEFHRKRKDFDTALSYCNALLGKKPDSPMAHYMKGLVLYDMADLKGARVELERVIKLNHKLADAYYKLGQIYAMQDEPSEAIRMYKLGRRYDPKNADARYELASIFMEKGKEKYAVAAIRSALAVDPDNDEFIDMLKNADYKKAEYVLERYLKEKPNDQSARFILAKLRVKLGDVVLARRDLEEVSRRLPRISPLRKEVHIELGRIYEREDPNRAAQEYKQAGELGGVQLELLQKLLETYREEKDEGRFVETAEKLLNLNPQNAELEYELGLIYERRAEIARKAENREERDKNLKKAIEHLSKAARIDNSNLEYNLKLAELLESQNKMKAFRIYSDMIDYYPDNPDLYYRRARFMLNFGVGSQSVLIFNMEDIISDLRKAIGLNPNHAGAHRLLGRVLDREGDIQGAIEEYEKALMLDPKDVEAMTYLAGRYSEMNRIEEAMQLYERALEIDPDNLDVVKDYAFLVLANDERRLPKAHKLLEHAFQVAPNDPLVVMNYGYSFYLMGNPRTAIQYYLKALELDPSSVLTRYNLALAYEAVEEMEKAGQMWQEILKLDPTSRYAELARERLKKAEK
jgi:superkiller protein 3